MSKLHQLHDRYGQSPWLDNRSRTDVTGDRAGGVAPVRNRYVPRPARPAGEVMT
jgi:hypothetical protein